MTKFFSYLLTFLILNSYLFANFDFSGHIVDIEDDSPLTSATIRIQNTQYGAYTNRKGEFTIKNLPDNFKNATIMITLIGYESLIENVNFEEKKEFIFKLKIQPLQTTDVVVTANKKVQALQEVPISMSVIDKRAILDRGAIELDDALKYMSGIEVNGSNVSIRGTSGFSFGIGSRALLLVDGFPIVSGDNADIKFDIVPMFDLNRVEAVKGAGSALWGTGAIGGVINLILDEPSQEGKFKYKAYSGIYTQPRYEQWELSDSPNMNSGIELSFSQKFNDLSVLASGSYFKNDSYREYDDNSRYNLFSKLAYDFSSSTKLKFLLNATSSNSADWVYWNSLDSATRPPTNTDRDNRITSNKYSVFGELSHTFDMNNYSMLKFGINHTGFYNSYGDKHPEYRQSDANSFYYELQNSSNIDISGELFNLIYGFTQTYTDVTSFTYGGRHQSIIAGYAQVEYTLPKVFTLTLGSRIDKELTEGIESDLEFSPKAGVSIPLYDNISLRASLGRGFRVASVAERYSAVYLQGFEVLPNLGLKPEESWSYELGSNLLFKIFDNPIEIDIALFDNELENLIEPSFAEGSSSKIQFKNITNARIQGAELTIRTLLFNTLGLETAFTFMDPRDLSNNELLNYRSELLWYSRVSIPYKFLELQLDYRYKSKVENIDLQLGLLVKDADARVPANVFDARLICNFKQIYDVPLRLTLSANNMFDYYYTTMVGNLAPTRFLSLQIDGEL